MFVASFALLAARLSAPALLDEVRHALHWDASAASGEIILRGKANVYGTNARYTLRFQPAGRFEQAFDGVLGERYGSDGTSYWKVNRDGVARAQTFEDVDEILGETLLLTDRWVDGRLDASLATDGGTIRMKLPGGLDERIDVDPETHLPTSASFPLSAGSVKISLSDWHQVGGREYPFHAEVQLTGERRSYDVQSGAVSNSSDRAAYVMPTRRPLDVTFDAGAPADLDVKRAVSGHLLVHPLVDGKDVGWFILDSGAETMCIDPKVANDLGLAKVGELPLTGVGGTVTGAFRPVKTFTLGPATIRNVYFAELALGELSQYFKVPIAGIVGDEYFDRGIVSIDVNRPAISVQDPAHYRLPPGADWRPMRFSSGNPLVEATANGGPTAWYRVDTGDPGTVTFHSPYVQREHLLEGRETEDGASGGVGGTVAARAGKIEQFSVGGHRFENLDATFSLAKEGAFADLYIAGNIGQTLMRPFTVVFDYANSRIAFIPR